MIILIKWCFNLVGVGPGGFLQNGCGFGKGAADALTNGTTTLYRRAVLD